MKAETRRIMSDQLEAELLERDPRPNQDLWDVRLVKAALVDAFLIYERLGGRIGPGGMKSSWTPFAADYNDLWQQRSSGTNVLGRERAKVQVTIAKIERAERVIEGSDEMAGWLRGPLDNYPMLKHHLTMWVMREVHNELGRDAVTVEQMCRKRGVKLATFNRHVKDAAYMIAVRLNRAKIEVW